MNSFFSGLLYNHKLATTSSFTAARGGGALYCSPALQLGQFMFSHNVAINSMQ